MKRLKNIIASTAIMTLLAGQALAQDQGYYDTGAAYEDSGQASYWSAALPIGAIAVAAIIIATTDHHHHHSSGHGSSSSSSTSCTSSSSSHFSHSSSSCF